METARGKRVQVVWRPNLWRVHRYWNTPEVDWRSWMRYWLAGSYSRTANSCDFAGESDFSLARYRDDSLNPLTPENRFAFLYEWTPSLDLCRAERRRLESSEPAARAAWDVYIQDDAISWLKAPCEPRDYDAPFYAYVHPVDPDDLPDWHKEDGFHPTPTSIRFADLGATFDGACLMSGTLPDYPIAAVQTGQWLPGGERMWEVFAIPPPNAEALALYEKIYQDATASGEPAARAGFDLYLNGDTLSYIPSCPIYLL